jgi:hypothetical protein
MQSKEWNGKYLIPQTVLVEELRCREQGEYEADMLRRHDLSEAQKTDYINAVLCLQKKPPKSPRDQFPGALNRYDDFVATHESMAFELHSTVGSTCS